MADPQPFDTTLLNAIVRFMSRKGMITMKPSDPAYESEIIDEGGLAVITAPDAGFFYRKKEAGDFVRKGDELGRIIDPCEGTMKARLYSSLDGIMFFAHTSPLALQNTPLFKIRSSAS